MTRHRSVRSSSWDTFLNTVLLRARKYRHINRDVGLFLLQALES